MMHKFVERATFLKSIFKSDKRRGMSNLAALTFSLLAEPLKTNYSPVFAQIEPTTRCNLNCYMCAISSQKIKALDLSLSQFKHILNQLPFLRKLSLVGRGEPLLNPELFEMIVYTKGKNIAVGFATNAILLDQKACKRIIDSKLDWLNISLDGADNSSYEKVRQGGDFEKVIDNIKYLVRLKGKKKTLDISVWFLLLKENIHTLPQMVSLLKNIGIKKLWVQSPHCWGDNMLLKEQKENFVLANNSDEVKKVLHETAKKSRAEDVSFKYTNIPDKAGKRRCKRVWFSPYIAVDGYVTPCCVNGSDSNVINFGNIFDKPFEDIWNNARYQNFRKRLKSKDIPSICTSCPAYYEDIKIQF